MEVIVAAAMQEYQTGLLVWRFNRSGRGVKDLIAANLVEMLGLCHSCAKSHCKFTQTKPEAVKSIIMNMNNLSRHAHGGH